MKVKKMKPPIGARMLEFLKNLHWYFYVAAVVFLAWAAFNVARLPVFTFYSVMRSVGIPLVFALIALRFALKHHVFIQKQRKAIQQETTRILHEEM